MELKDYLIPLRKWWWLIVAATLVATGSSYLATRQQPFNYTARAALLVGRSIQSTNPQDYELNASQQLGQTYANLAVRRPIREGVRAALGLSWLPAYTAKMVPNAQLLEIQVIDTDPERAAAVANEVANQLILQTPAEERDLQQRRKYLSRELQDSETVMDETKAEIQRLRTEMASMFSARQTRRHPGPDRGAGAEADVLPGRLSDIARFRPGRREYPPGGRAGRGPDCAQRPEQARDDPAGRGHRPDAGAGRGVPAGIPGRHPQEPG